MHTHTCERVAVISEVLFDLILAVAVAAHCMWLWFVVALLWRVFLLSNTLLSLRYRRLQAVCFTFNMHACT